MRKALFFFPQIPYPPQSGLHRRGLETLSLLREAGYQITFASSDISAMVKWSPDDVTRVAENVALDVRVYAPSRFDYRFARVISLVNEKIGREPAVDSPIFTPPGMRRWFRGLVDEISPDLIVMTYARWDGLINHVEHSPWASVMESIDLVTLNRRMWKAVESRLPAPPICAADVPDAVLGEDFYKRLGLTANPREFAVFDRYDYTITLSAVEADLIRRKAPHTKVIHLPMTLEPVEIANRYDSAAVLPTGNNPYNVQGLLYFIRRVLPHVRSATPDFSLDVTGYCCEQVSAHEGINMRGFVQDIATLYERAPFALCPIFGGTGQQVKIVEAMAHGVPVVALRSAADRSPIIDGVNGLVADTAAQFAELVVMLWNDRRLCRTFGDAARQAVADQYAASRHENPFLEIARESERSSTA